MNGSLVTDLGLGPEIWLFLTLLGCVTLFFKFSRIWSVRNLDLLLLFALAPGMMLLVGKGEQNSLGRVSVAVHRVRFVVGPCGCRPGIGPPSAPGAQSECLGVAVSLGGNTWSVAGRDGEPAGRGGGRAKPGRAVRPGRPIGTAGRAITAPRPSN